MCFWIEKSMRDVKYSAILIYKYNLKALAYTLLYNSALSRDKKTTRKRMNLSRQPTCQLAMNQRTMSAIVANNCLLAQLLLRTTRVLFVTSTDIYCCECRTIVRKLLIVTEKVCYFESKKKKKQQEKKIGEKLNNKMEKKIDQFHKPQN